MLSMSREEVQELVDGVEKKLKTEITNVDVKVENHIKETNMKHEHCTERHEVTEMNVNNLSEAINNLSESIKTSIDTIKISIDKVCSAISNIEPTVGRLSQDYTRIYTFKWFGSAVKEGALWILAIWGVYNVYIQYF